jgi:hypothetical protein
VQTETVSTTHRVDKDYLARCLSAFFEQKLPDIQKRYKGREKHLTTPLGPALASFGPNHLRQNQRLRQKLSVDEKSASPTRKAELAIWYVTQWGGVVHKDGGKKLVDFSTTAPADLIALGSDGIASWSKILSYRRYNTCAVFDARVSGCLNAIQIIFGGELKHAFPLLETRGAPAKAFSELLKSSAPPLPLLPSDRFYELYCGLLRSQWRQLTPKLKWHARTWHGLEMTLFHEASAIFEQAADKLDSRQFYEQRLTDISAENAEAEKKRKEKKQKEAALG